jgi:TolB-like protein/tRNA A-37 threonylcarbamoyl transferase component Bud32
LASVSPDQWETAKSLFQSALERPLGERQAFVEHATAEDPAIRREVLSLLSNAGDTSIPDVRTAVAEAIAKLVRDDRGLLEGLGPPPQLVAALEDRYEIQREIGRGGMATVYLAQDLRHHRHVAIKVLHPELAALLGATRFLQEIKLTANLHHPHLLPLFDSGDAGGLPFYVMPYVAGGSLRERLRRDARPTVAEAAQITRQVADALDYAHRHGVVHRDIKPENVLLDETGHAIVADFGIARAIRRAAAGVGEESKDRTLTRTGFVIGTPAYMSPEQRHSDREPDGRSDQYSLACVSYEMLTGEPPSLEPSVEQSAENLSRALGSVQAEPWRLERAEEVIRRALAGRPADRFPTAVAYAEALSAALTPSAEGHRPRLLDRLRVDRGIVRHLRWFAAAIIIGGVAWWTGAAQNLIGAFAVRQPNTGGDVRGHVVWLAILPFQSEGAATDSAIAAETTEQMHVELARLGLIQITPRTTSTQYFHSASPPEDIARQLDVEFLLTGVVQVVPRDASGSIDRMRVRLEVVRVLDGRPPVVTWQESLGASGPDLAAARANILRSAARAMAASIVAAANHAPAPAFVWRCDQTRRRCSLRSTSVDRDNDALRCRFRSDHPAQDADKVSCDATRDYESAVTAWDETLTVDDGHGGVASVTQTIVPGAPPKPTGLAVTTRARGCVALAWRDESADETHFEVTRDGSLAQREAANATKSTLCGLRPGWSYHWDVRACNATACSPYNGVIGKTPDGSDGPPPPCTMVATGPDVWVRFVGHSGGDRNSIHWYETPHGQPRQGLFNNSVAIPGAEMQLAYRFTTGEEVIIGMTANTTTTRYWSGPASRNPDGLVHFGAVPVAGEAKYQLRGRFEETLGGGDFDYDDLMIDLAGVKCR